MTQSPRQYLVTLDRLWAGLAATVVFLLLALALGLLTPGLDPSHQAISAISLGPFGWAMNLSFLGLGLVLLTTVPAWRWLLYPGPASSAYPIATAAVGTCFLLVAFLPQDPAPGYDPAGLHLTRPTGIGLLHLALAGVAAVAHIVGLFALARRFKHQPGWQRWARSAQAVAISMIVCITIYGVWSVRPSGWAGTFERMALLLPAWWSWALLRRLSRGASPL